MPSAGVERAAGIEPASSAWKAEARPLDQARSDAGRFCCPADLPKATARGAWFTFDQRLRPRLDPPIRAGSSASLSGLRSGHAETRPASNLATDGLRSTKTLACEGLFGQKEKKLRVVSERAQDPNWRGRSPPVRTSARYWGFPAQPVKGRVAGTAAANLLVALSGQSQTRASDPQPHPGLPQ